MDFSLQHMILSFLLQHCGAGGASLAEGVFEGVAG